MFLTVYFSNTALQSVVLVSKKLRCWVKFFQMPHGFSQLSRLYNIAPHVYISVLIIISKPGMAVASLRTVTQNNYNMNE